MKAQEQLSEVSYVQDFLLIFTLYSMVVLLLETVQKLDMSEVHLQNLIVNFIKFSEQLFSKTALLWPGVWCGIPTSVNQKI